MYGRDITIDELLKRYDAIYISVGANEPNNTLNQENVLSANKLLEELNEERIEKNSIEKYKKIFNNKKVAVNGGGNVAMDAARSLKRLGADVTIIYRRSINEMPAAINEIEAAKKENIEFLFQTNIVSFNGSKKEMELIKTDLQKNEDDLRLVPVNIPNSNYKKEFDYCILATGSLPDKEFIEELKIKTDDKGYIKVNEKHQTSNEKIFAGGDIIKSRATVANASYDGREAAKSIIEFLNK